MKRYGLPQVRAAVKAAVAAHPDRINPVSGQGACAYTSAADPNWHCIAGQVLVDLGLPCPPPDTDATNFDDLVERDDRIGSAFTAAAVSYLSEIQFRADDASLRHDKPWSTIDLAYKP